MTSDKEAEANARECVRLALFFTDLQARERLLQMAREWMAVAMAEGNPPESKLLVS
jgi:hypothetical protein